MGADEDIVVSSARAYISAINKILGFQSPAAAAAAAASNALKVKDSEVAM